MHLIGTHRLVDFQAPQVVMSLSSHTVGGMLPPSSPPTKTNRFDSFQYQCKESHCEYTSCHFVLCGISFLIGDLMPCSHCPLQLNQSAQMFRVYVPIIGCWQIVHAKTLNHQITLITDFLDSQGNFKKHLPHMYFLSESSHISFTPNVLPFSSVCLIVCQCTELCKKKGHFNFKFHFV